MSVLVVGGDHLGRIPKELDKLGFTEIYHLTGRGGQKACGRIPEKVLFVILLYDFVNHNLAYKVKKFANDRGVPIVYAKRSWASIYKKMKESQQQLSKAGLHF